MTTSAVIPQITFQGSSGSGTLGPFSLIKSGKPIYFTANSQIKVYRYDTTTDTAPTLLVEGTDYDLTGGPSAGSITLTSPQTGLLTAERLFVYREQPVTQSLDLSFAGNFSSGNIEARFDRTYEIIEELRREVQSGVRFSLFDTDNIPNTLPLGAAIDKLVYVSGTAAAPTLATIDSPANLLANIQLTADNIANINLVGSDLGGADTIGIVAADLDGDNTVGTVAGNIGDVQAVAAALGDGTIGTALSGGYLNASSYIALVGTTYTDNADAIQALFNASTTSGKAIIYDTTAEIKGTLYLRDGMRIAACPGYVNITADATWTAKGTSAHNSQAAILCAGANGDATYGETTVEVDIDYLDVRLTNSVVAAPYTAMRLTGLRNSHLNLKVTATGTYTTTTASGAQSIGAANLTVASVAGVEIGDTIVVGGAAYTVRDTWDEVSTTLPLADEDGAATTLSRDVTNGEAVYIGPESTPLHLYRDNRDSHVHVESEQDACRGGIWIGEFSLDAQAATYETDGLFVRCETIQQGPCLDESVAVFNSGSGSAGMGHVEVEVNAICNTRALGVLNNTDEEAVKFFCSVKSVNAYVKYPKSGAAAVRFENSAAQLQHFSILMLAPTTTDTVADVWGIRSDSLDANREPPKIANGTVTVRGSTSGKTPIIGITGPARWENVKVETIDSAEVQWAAENINSGEIIGGDFCDGSSGCMNTVRKVIGGTITRGLLNEVDYFDGNVEDFDSTTYSNVIANTDAAANFYFRAGHINLATTTALTRVVSASACLSARVEYDLVLASGGSAPSNADSLPSSGVDVRSRVLNASGFVSGALGLASILSQAGITFTPTVYFGTIDATTAGTPATFSTRTGEYWRVGNMLFMRASVTFTAKGTGTGTLGIGTPSGLAPADYNVGGQGITTIANMTGLTQAPVAASNASGTPRIFFTQINSGGTATESITDAHVTDTTAITIFAAYALA